MPLGSLAVETLGIRTILLFMHFIQALMFDRLDRYDTGRPTSFMPDVVAVIENLFNSYITTYLTVYVRIQNPADPNHSKFPGSSPVTHELALT